MQRSNANEHYLFRICSLIVSQKRFKAKGRSQILFHDRAQASQELSSTQGGETRTRKESRRKTRRHKISEVR